MTLLGEAGILLVAVGVAVIVAELGWLGLRLWAVQRRLRPVLALIVTEVAQVETEVKGLDAMAAELTAGARLLRSRVRWAKHPLLLALVASYRRRRRRARLQ